MRVFLFFLVVFSISCGDLFAQEERGALDSLHLEIVRLRANLMSAQTDSTRTIANDSLLKMVEVFLDEKGSFEYPLKVQYLGDLYSPDGAFRMVTWNIPVKKGEFVYFNFIQTKPGKNNSGKVVELIDESEKYDSGLEYKRMKYTAWYGALYYQIIPKKVKGTTVYALLGWDGNTKMSNIKLVEAMYFDQRGFPRFGYSFFNGDGRSKRRLVLEHAEDARIVLKYDDKRDWIVFHRLEPMQPEMEGIKAYYVPSNQYDAYEWIKKNWEFKEDVDMKAPKNKKPFINPNE